MRTLEGSSGSIFGYLGPNEAGRTTTIHLLPGLLIVLGVFGIMVPFQSGSSWVEQPVAIVYWAWLPLFLVIGAIADPFAGERGRHTLEALPATRLSDKAILLGMVTAAVVCG